IPEIARLISQRQIRDYLLTNPTPTTEYKTALPPIPWPISIWGKPRAPTNPRPLPPGILPSRIDRPNDRDQIHRRKPQSPLPPPRTGYGLGIPTRTRLQRPQPMNPPRAN